MNPGLWEEQEPEKKDLRWYFSTSHKGQVYMTRRVKVSGVSEQSESSCSLTLWQSGMQYSLGKKWLKIFFIHAFHIGQLWVGRQSLVAWILQNINKVTKILIQEQTCLLVCNSCNYKKKKSYVTEFQISEFLPKETINDLCFKSLSVAFFFFLSSYSSFFNLIARTNLVSLTQHSDWIWVHYCVMVGELGIFKL